VILFIYYDNIEWMQLLLCYTIKVLFMIYFQYHFMVKVTYISL
jgi:hypothetical protein